MAAEGSNSNFTQACIPKFDGDYDYWSMVMENLLRSKEYWGLIETGYAEPGVGEKLTAAQEKTLEEMKLKDLKVKNYLFQSIDKSILKTILQKHTSKQLWDSMKRKYQGNKRVQRAQLQALRRDFEVLEMKIGELVKDYFSRVMMVANDMRNLGEDMQDVKIVEKILRTLTDNFNYIVCSIEESKDINCLTVDELQSSLTVHEQKFRRTRGEEQALKVEVEEGRGRGNGGRGRGGAYRGGAYQGRGQGRGRQGFNKALVECYKCHKFGHFQSECPSWEKGANFAELDEGEEMLLMAHLEMYNPGKEALWFLDSGCSNHMTGDKQWFIYLDEAFRQVVKLGNNTKMEVMGKGSIKLKFNGVGQVITDVYYLPELKNNLLSIGQFQERDLAILIQNRMCKIYHPSRGLIIQAPMSVNRMFALLAEPETQAHSTPSCFKATSEEEVDLWHRRFGHLHLKGLRTLSHKKMVKGLPSLDVSPKVCTICMVGKQHREKIPKKSLWRATQTAARSCPYMWPYHT